MTAIRVNLMQIFAFISLPCLMQFVASQSYNPIILQDTRDLPKTDGTFGFLYRTEDGIAHAAKGDKNGVIHGRFSYTDPTGLKVNYNYNAGSQVNNYAAADASQYNEEAAQPPIRQQQRTGEPSRTQRLRRPQLPRQNYHQVPVEEDYLASRARLSYGVEDGYNR